MNIYFSFIQVFFVTSLCYVTVYAGTAYEDSDYPYRLSVYLNSLNHTHNLFPVKNFSKVIQVHIEFYFGQLITLDGAKQTLKVSGYLGLTWIDERLVWDPTLFGGVNLFTYPKDKIWSPRLIVYNGAGDSQTIELQQNVNMMSIALNQTLCNTVVKRDFEVSCSLDLSKFPNDEQECQVELMVFDEGRFINQVVAANSTTAHLINFLSLYSKSNEWDLLSFSQYANFQEYQVFKTGPKMPMSIYLIKFKFRREAAYYVNNVVIPLILLTMLQILVFFVPTESGEKMSLGITILLSFTVFLLLLDSIIPKSKTMPSIAYFITGAMTISSVSLVLSSLILRLYYTEEDYPMSRCSKVFFLKILARITCVKVPPQMLEDSIKPITEIVSSNSKLEKAEESGDSRCSNLDVNPWKLAAMTMERIMVFIGIIMVTVLMCIYLIPPFTN